MRPFWSDLYYIELAPDGKRPAGAWGGYEQDFDEASGVRSAAELLPGERYGYIGHSSMDLGVVDLDLYKDAAPDDADVVRTGRELLTVRSPSGGMHVPFLLPEGEVARTKDAALDDEGPDAMLRVSDGLSDWVDIKGEVAGGHCVLPFGTEYEVGGGSAETPPVLASADEAELRKLLNVDGEPVLETEERGSVPGGLSGRPPGDVLGALPDGYEEGRRHEHPFHGSTSGSNFYVFPSGEFFYCYRHECGGTLLHLLGMEQGAYECGDWARMEPGERATRHRAVRTLAEDGDADLSGGVRRWTNVCSGELDEELEAR